MRGLIACMSMVLMLVACGVAEAKTRVGTGGNVHAVAGPDGTAHVVWQTGTTLSYCRVAPGTETCAASQTWSAAGALGTDVDVVRAPSTGTVHVVVSVWTSGGQFPGAGLWSIASTQPDAAGNTWAAPKRMTDGTAGTGVGNTHQGTIYGPGAFEIGWLSQVGAPTRLTFGTTNAPGVTQGAVDTNLEGAYEADVGLAAGGAPLVVSRSTNTGVTTYRSWGGTGNVRNVGTWRAPQTLGDIGSVTDLGSNGIAAPVLGSYSEVAGTDWRITLRKYDFASDSFGAPVTVNDDDTPRNVWMFMDSASNVHSLWTSGTSRYAGASSTGLVYSASTTGDSWPKYGIVLDQGTSTGVPALAAGSSGAGVAVWTRDAGNGSTDDDEVYLGAVGGPGSAFPVDPPPPGDPPPQPPPVDPSCVKQPTLGVAKLLATGCFKKTTGTKLTTAQPFLLNGVTVDPGGKTVTVDTAKRTLETGSASLTLGVIKLGKGKLDYTFPATGSWTKPGGAIDLDKAGFGGQLLGLAITGDGTLKLTADGKSLLTGYLRLPKPFDGVTAKLDFKADNFSGLQLEGLKSHIDDLGLGFHDLDLQYTSDPPTWTGKLKFQPSVLGGSGTDFEGEITLVNGSLQRLAIAAKFDAPGRELYPPLVYLRYAGLELELDPALLITGKVVVAGGASPTDTPLVSVGRPYDDFGTLKLRLSSPFSLRADGPVYVLGSRLGSGYFQYSYPGSIEFGAEARIGSCDGGIAGVEASAKGFVELSGGFKFNAKGQGRACLGSLSAGATAVLSSKGIAACASFKFPPISAGAGLFWGDLVPDLMPLLCDTEPYEVAQSAQAGGAIQVKPGLKQLNVIATGDTGVPLVTLVGPNGLRYEGVASGVVTSPTGVSVGEPDLKRQTFLIAKPPAGAWTLEPAAGSPGVAKVQVTRDAPPLKVTGRVKRGELRWKQAGGSGQTVTFYEQGEGVLRKLGVARGASGTLRWKPKVVRGGRRSVVAVGEVEGLASDSFTLGAFTVPKPPKPGVARKLKATHRSGALQLTWTPAKYAARQELRVQLSNGIGQVFRVSARTKRLKVPNVASTVTGRVTIVGLRADGVAGKTARATVKRAPKKR
ncbi:hypothetical protein OJ997_02035 [Solirubrobacter phytolaccae]|uniref:Fibronectin type-III domain-containing protein n=1 Tax=Solirubrobacter phytolaccae TaxID=1404360 RepID=A0A9X3S5L1_9ACTN|nr:hypothetical protein [Solirubrobacter phytolaccae]MDA0179059.1 hypothetical protein [Solirubrobacter phytolaccae]